MFPSQKKKKERKKGIWSCNQGVSLFPHFWYLQYNTQFFDTILKKNPKELIAKALEVITECNEDRYKASAYNYIV